MAKKLTCHTGNRSSIKTNPCSPCDIDFEESQALEEPPWMRFNRLKYNGPYSCGRGLELEEVRPPADSRFCESREAVREKLFSSKQVLDCMKWTKSDHDLSCVDRKFRQYPLGLLGKGVVHYGAAQDMDFPKAMAHGILSSGQDTVAELISPPPLSKLAKIDNDVAESIYLSNKVMPLGRSHDQRNNLPPTFELTETIFGRSYSNKSTENAGILINPPKSRDEVEKESEKNRSYYKLSHGIYGTGEQICRNYTGNFDYYKTYGMPTPHDIAGRSLRKVIGSWKSCEPDPILISKTYVDHLHFRKPKLGQALDQYKLGKTLGSDFMFGTDKRERDPPIKQVLFKHYEEDENSARCICPKST